MNEQNRELEKKPIALDIDDFIFQHEIAYVSEK